MSPTDGSSQPVRVLTAIRRGAVLALPMAACGRATPVVVSAGLPLTARWLAGLACAPSQTDRPPWWLVDALPPHLPDHGVTTVALLAAGLQPAWGLLIDHLEALTLAVAGGGAPVPLALPGGWYAGCLLADGRRAALLDPQALCTGLARTGPVQSAA